jgi:DNA-binding transcriptional regulator YiaG
MKDDEQFSKGESMSFDTLIDAKLEEKMADKLPSLVAKEVARIGQMSPWMTEQQLADYWQVSAASIKHWTARKEEPLPCGSMGEMRRYHRDDVDRWAREERRRQQGAKSVLKAVGK